MIEEATQLPGAPPETASAPTDTASENGSAANGSAANGSAANGSAADTNGASAEKPKVTRRRAVKNADATLPLDGVEIADGALAAPAKPKRATRTKKVAEAADGDSQAAPEKPKRITRAKKAATEADADQAGAQIKAESAPDNDKPARDEAAPNRAPQADSPALQNETAPAPIEALHQHGESGMAPFQMAPAVAMGSFTPAPSASSEIASDATARRGETAGDLEAALDAPERNAPAQEAPREPRGENREPRSEARDNRAEARDNDSRGEARDNRGESEDESDDFRGGRLSYRDRRALRREQRIVSRTGTGDESGETPRESRDGARDRDGAREPREVSNRENGGRDNAGRESGGRDASRENGGRDNGTRELRDRSNRDGREANRDNRNGNREDRAPREERLPREERAAREDRPSRENRREAREGRREGREGFASSNGRRREYDLTQLDAMEGAELQSVVAELGMDEAPGEKSALIYAILEAQAATQNAILKKGILEILPDGKGFLRTENYYPSEGDVYVSQTQIKKFGLKTGDEVLGTARVPKENERYHGLLRVESINGLSIESSRERRDFDKLTPIFPTERFPLETEPGNITARIIDLISPIGKGQRGLIVAPPKAGKTTLIKNIANSITENNPEVLLFVLLIDERPEEVTDISRSVRGTVVASTFDEVPENHIRVSDIVLERAKRLVEMGNDVVVLLDSITRLSRASNLVVAPSGRTMSGGLDPAAMYKPKRHFGAARNIENGGSLTVLATVLVDTGSRMDEYIFEELKGTGNLDLVLDRDLFNQRIFPAIDINRSGTRRDDLLLDKDELAATFHLRRTLAALDNDKAVTLLIDRLKSTKSNANFMEVVAKSQRNQAT